MTSPEIPTSPRPTAPVEYKGEPLDAGRGPGLGCFYLQMIVLGTLIVMTPLSVSWGWPPMVSAVLLFVVILLLLLTGQTMIFLLRIVAAGRSEGRRRPLAAQSPTVGEIEDAVPVETASADADEVGHAPSGESAPADSAEGPGSDAPAMRQ